MKIEDDISKITENNICGYKNPTSQSSL